MYLLVDFIIKRVYILNIVQTYEILKWLFLFFSNKIQIESKQSLLSIYIIIDSRH